MLLKIHFCFFTTLTYIVGTEKNRLVEMGFLSTHVLEHMFNMYSGNP